MTDTENRDPDQAIVKALGEELRRARVSLQWTRPELVKRMVTPIPVNTYAGYEQGIRQCSVPRLVEICVAMGTSAVTMLRLAFQRLELQTHDSTVVVDLRKIIDDDRDELSQFRYWARVRMKEDGSDPDAPCAEWLRSDVLREFAVFLGVDEHGMRRLVRDFTPDSVSMPKHRTDDEPATVLVVHKGQ